MSSGRNGDKTIEASNRVLPMLSRFIGAIKGEFIPSLTSPCIRWAPSFSSTDTLPTTIPDFAAVFEGVSLLAPCTCKSEGKLIMNHSKLPSSRHVEILADIFIIRL